MLTKQCVTERTFEVIDILTVKEGVSSPRAEVGHKVVVMASRRSSGSTGARGWKRLSFEAIGA